jgi:lipoprotein-anchoring transpeptidase ErfK/SrfK
MNLFKLIGKSNMIAPAAFAVLFLAIFFSVRILDSAANGLPDADRDGVPDEDEALIYRTDPNSADTDGDGYGDWIELNKGFSPWERTDKKMELTDFDRDGLFDRQELNWGIDPTKPDTDGDGHGDKEEMDSTFDPKKADGDKLEKRIEVDLRSQTLSYYQGEYKIGSFLVSSGVRNTTPRGTFKIYNKSPNAWSSYGLWMPYWMSFTPTGKMGLHELPYWPNGRREGESSLGHPASHGCVRMGRNGEAKTLYEWAPVGTPVIIK